VHFIDRLTFGGLQTVVMDLCEAQRQAGHFVEIAVRVRYSNNPGAAGRMAAAGVEIVKPYRGQHRGRFLAPLAAIYSLASYIKERKFEVVHSHNPFSIHYVTLASRLARVPTVNTMHATAMIPRMTKPDKLLYFGSALITQRTISVHSESLATLRGFFPLPAAKLGVVENGIALTHYFAVPKRQPRALITFGAIGRMERVKNHRLLIEAFALVKARIPNVQLRILGEGPLEDELRRHAIELGVADCVELCPFRADPWSFLAEIDIFCLSSDSEGLPMSLLEALAAGLPVVATEVGGVPDVVKKTDGGWLSRPGDVTAFAAAMEQAIADTDRIGRGERARRRVETYSVARMAANYQRIYESMLAKPA
jgi:glycosyltransferase involved in cell wall biosynthesis